MKRCSTCLTIGETQIKTTMRQHLSHPSGAVIKEIRSVGEVVKEREPLHTVAGKVQLLWKTAWRGLKKLKIELL